MRAKSELGRREREMRFEMVRDDRKLSLITLIEKAERNLDNATSERMKEFWEDQLNKSMAALLHA